MRDIKTKLIKLLPNNEEFDLINHEKTHHDILTFNDNEYIVWSITREGRCIWVEMEDSTPFGQSMGRYYSNLEDVPTFLYPFILERVITNVNYLKSKEQSK